MNKKVLLLLCLFVLGFVVRFYRFSGPVADWHSWRQADTSAVSQNFVDNGFDVLHPMYYDISNVQSGLDNPKGLRLVEFPLYNIFQAGLYVLFHTFTIEEWGRIVSIIASLLTSLFLFLIVRKHANVTQAILTLLFSLFLPYNIYYGRTILPDTSMVMAALGGIYFFDIWLQEKKKKGVLFFFLSSLFFASALLFKPYAIFYALPIIVLAINRFKASIIMHWQVWVYAVIVLAPIILWRKYILQFPEGIPVSTWLLNGNGIRFRPAFFRWIFYERITKLISGYANIIFILLGTFSVWKEKQKYFLLSFPISALLYVAIFATGNVQHDYYQIVIMPSIALLMGFGSVWLAHFLKRFIGAKAACVALAVLILGGFYLSWQQVKDYFNINNSSIITAGIEVQKLTPKNAKVIAPLNGDTTLLYAIKRKGWPSFEHDLPTLISMGADYLLLINPKEYDYNFASTYKMVKANPDYLLYKLH